MADFDFSAKLPAPTKGFCCSLVACFCCLFLPPLVPSNQPPPFFFSFPSPFSCHFFGPLNEKTTMKSPARSQNMAQITHHLHQAQCHRCTTTQYGLADPNQQVPFAHLSRSSLTLLILLLLVCFVALPVVSLFLPFACLVVSLFWLFVCLFWLFVLVVWLFGWLVDKRACRPMATFGKHMTASSGCCT